MLKISDKENFDLNQISLTGMRAILLLGLLVKAPRTLEEIRSIFQEFEIMDETASDDILRIDINTLRTMGCEISRADIKTGFRYTLTKHPFQLNLTSEEVNVLKKVYKRVKDSANIKMLIQYDELFKKIANFVSDEKIKEEIYGILALKNYHVDLVNELLQDCKENNVLKLVYKNPDTKEESEKEIYALRLVYQNDKVYLYGYDYNKQESVVLNVKRIKSILSRILNKGDIEVKSVCVKFFLKNFGITEADECETIMEKREDGFIIEGKYHTEFIAIQRILSFGANCTVLEPSDFRDKIIQKLKDMRKIYND